MSTFLKTLSEAATTAAQAVIIPTAAVSIEVAALALMSRRTFVSQQQAAARIGVTPRTIRNKISEGILTGYRIPGSRAIRVDLDEIERLMQVMPAAMRPRKPFGPRAKIVTVAEVLEPSQDQDQNGEVSSDSGDGTGATER
jgi:excisionase family DNA binding protein